MSASKAVPLLWAMVALGAVACGPPPGARPSPRPEPARRGAPRNLETRRPVSPPVARCPPHRAPPLALPAHVRSVHTPGPGWRVVTAGLRASERPPCKGRCPPLRTTVALVDAAGTVCWRVDLPAEHRLGPVGHAGGTLWLAGPRRVFAVSWTGGLLRATVVEGLRPGPVALRDGGAAFLDGEGAVVAFRKNGTKRWRRKPRTTARPLALAPRPGGGVGVAFRQEVRGYDADGVEMFKVALPEPAPRRGLAFHGATAFWVWSERGAYHVEGGRRIASRQPPRAPRDGRLFAGALGPKGLFYALMAERGFHPVKVIAVMPTNSLHWTRPFTGDRPAGCVLWTGPGQQLAIRCKGNRQGRAVVRDAKGITRFDEGLDTPQVALGPGQRYAVAGQYRTRDMTLMCRARWYVGASETPRKVERKGRCPVLWLDGGGAVYLGSAKVGAP